MTSTKLRRKSASVAHSRWASYATAGAATALGCVATTEDALGDITYSGPINQFFSGNSAFFTLGSPGNSFNPFHSGSVGGGAGFVFIYGNVAASIAGFSANGFQYALNLGAGININGIASFVPTFGTLAFGSGFTYSQWTMPGTGFVAFSFDAGGGTQYGWARLTVQGVPGNTFTLVDFAYGDVGDQIATGQIPEPGSLALLALGAVGLVAWRKVRVNKAA